MPYAESESQSLYESWKRYGGEELKQESDASDRIIEQARAALAEAIREHGSVTPAASPDSISIGWSIEDVQELRPDLTDDQCRDVLRRVEDRHHADIGVNWDIIEEAAEELFPSPDATPPPEPVRRPSPGELANDSRDAAGNAEYGKAALAAADPPRSDDAIASATPPAVSERRSAAVIPDSSHRAQFQQRDDAKGLDR